MTQNNNPAGIFGRLVNDMLEDALNSGQKPGPGLFDMFAKPAAPKAPAAADEAPQTEAKDTPKPASPFPNFDLNTVLADVLKETAPLRQKAQGFFEKAENPFVFTSEFKVAHVPPMDAFLTEDSIEYRFAAAGITAEGVEAELDGDRLTITLTLPEATTEGTVLNREIWAGKSTETFVVPTENEEGLKREIDEENIKASVKDGLVSIVVPFKERIKTKITVS